MIRSWLRKNTIYGRKKSSNWCIHASATAFSTDIDTAAFVLEFCISTFNKTEHIVKIIKCKLDENK